jgi:hypothetical protein
MNITTTNLADFGICELEQLEVLIKAYRCQQLPQDFSDDEVVPMMNKNSGNVFLTNSNYEVAMMNGDQLETWYYCFNCGHEGFADECQLNDEGCNECQDKDQENEHNKG